MVLQNLSDHEDGIVSGFLSISGWTFWEMKSMTITTEKTGRLKEAAAGTYLVKELPVDRYVTLPAQYVTIESGQTSTVHFQQYLKKFRVHVVKSDADTTEMLRGTFTLAGGSLRDL